MEVKWARWRKFSCMVLILLGFIIRSNAEIACEESGYCSIGQTQPWSGDVFSGEGLRNAIQARSYKKEMIIMISSVSHMLTLTQAVLNLRSIGLEHVLILGPDENQCRKIAVRHDAYGCAWDSFQLPIPDYPPFGPAMVMWHTRWRTLARAVKLGINILCTDTDVVFFHDPYKFFKSPPFNDAVIINQAEALWSGRDYLYCDKPNGGVIYVQNASPTGPAMWLIAEVSHRLLRFIDSDWSAAIMAGAVKHSNYVDQDCLTDSIYSVRSGILTFHLIQVFNMNNTWRDAHEDVWKQRYERLNEVVKDTIKAGYADLPETIAPIAGEKRTYMRSFDMRMPSMGQTWDESLGPNIYGEVGPMTTNFLNQMKRDCQTDPNGPDCPMWPDPEDPKKEKAARATPTEKYLFAPPFLMYGYYPRGRKGYWYKEALDGPVQQVIGHLHYNPATQMGLIGKVMAKMALGQYDWQAARELHAGHIYHMYEQMGGKKDLTHHPPNSDKRIPKILALHPSVRLDLLIGTKDFQEILIGLAQVAEATKRTLVYPDMPCHIEWTKARGHIQEGDPLPVDNDWIPHPKKSGHMCEPANEAGAEKITDKRHMFNCMYAPLGFDGCLMEFRGLLSVEFEHMMEQHKQQLPMEPGKMNTFLTWTGRPGENPRSPTEDLLIVDQDQVVQVAAKYDHMRVLYVGHPVQVSTQKHTKWAHWHTDCPGLDRVHIQNDHMVRPSPHSKVIRRKANIADDGSLEDSGEEVTWERSTPSRSSLRRDLGAHVSSPSREAKDSAQLPIQQHPKIACITCHAQFDLFEVH